MCIARQLSCSLTKLIRCHAVWPDWAIFYTFGNFLKPLATTNLPKSLTFLGNFCKGVKSYHFLVKSILGNFYRHLVNFFWWHWIVMQQNCVIYAAAENVSIKIYVLPCRWLSPASAARNLALWRLKRMDYEAMLRQKAWTPFAPGPRLSGRYCDLLGRQNIDVISLRKFYHTDVLLNSRQSLPESLGKRPQAVVYGFKQFKWPIRMLKTTKA